MSFQFEDQTNIPLRRNVYSPTPRGFISSFLLKHNLAKDDSSANRIMVTMSVAVLIFAAALITINFIKANAPVKVKYNISKKAFNMLPQDIQIKILEQ